MASEFFIAAALAMVGFCILLAGVLLGYDAEPRLLAIPASIGFTAVAIAIAAVCIAAHKSR